MKNMINIKKLLFIALVALSSCKKQNCNCGIITDDKINTTNNGLQYTLTIKNTCSSNNKTFVFDQQTWYNNQVGDDFCVSNVDSW